MKLFKSGGFPLALAVSILVHLVLFRAIQVRTSQELPERERYEVKLAYVDPAELSRKAVQRDPPGRARLGQVRGEVREQAALSPEEVLDDAPEELPDVRETPPAGAPFEAIRELPAEEGEILASAAGEVPRDRQASDGGETRGSLTLAEGQAAQPSAGPEAPGVLAAGVHAAATGAAPRSRSDIDRINEELSRRIDQRKVYPPAARKRGVQGTVVCRLEVDRRGNLVGLNVVVSSGSRVLDDAAVNLLEKVFPVSNLSGVELTLEKAVRYSLVE